MFRFAFVRLTTIIARVVLIASIGVLLASPASSQIPQEFTNLQVLDEDITPPLLIEAMKNMAMGLGVRCWYCHVGEGDDLSTFDFSSDKKPSKKIARAMILMTQAINAEYLAEINETLLPERFPTREEPFEVTCNSCHRGDVKPEK